MPLVPALLLAGLAPLGGAGDEPSREAEAAERFAAAERHVARGRHARAVSEYRLVARVYPATEAGRAAAERTRPTAFLGSADLLRHGPSGNRVDVVVTGDGYTLDQQDRFDDVAKVVPRLFEHDPLLQEYLRYHNFVRMNLVSAEAGVDGFGREYETACGAYTLGTWSGHVAVDVAATRRWLDELPGHDGHAIVYVKRGVLGSGGGGIAAVGGRGDATTIHEWGHAFAGLGDEYTTSNGHQITLGRTFAGRANLSVTDDPDLVPWRHFLDEGVRGVGVYEGAAGRVEGVFKPTASSCRMENGQFFCPVCAEAIVLRIHQLVDPIDRVDPPAHPEWVTPEVGALANPLVDGEVTFEVEVLRPSSHDLEVSWWVLPHQRVPPHPRPPRTRHGDRRDRGPLPPVGAEPFETTREGHPGIHRFTLRAREHEPGHALVLCRVRDDTRLRGERHPIVIRDEHDLLVSERRWWVLVE